MAETKKIVIIGGGITGLSAAYYMQKLCREKGLPHHVTLIEKESKLGGKIQTIRRDGFVIEKGPDSFLARKLSAYQLTKELGLESELVPTNPQAKKTYIIHKNRFHRLPQGLMLGIPTEVGPFVKTKLISPLGKLRAGLDLLLPKRKDEQDESLGHFLQRRLGNEVLERIAEPLLAGIYAGDTFQLSLKATFPQFRALERNHRSLIRGMMSSKGQAAASTEVPEIVKQSTFLSYKNGLHTLVEKLTEALHAVDILTDTSVRSVQHSPPFHPGEGQRSAYQVHLTNGVALDADTVIMALPARVNSLLLPTLPAVRELEKIRYVSVANVIMAFDRKDIEHPLDGSGFVVPRKEKRTITACTWTSSKWGHTAPEGKVLIRCYVGRAGDEDITFADEETILAKVQQDLAELMKINAKPLFYELNRWPNSMPQYPVGHLESVERVRTALNTDLPGIYMVGAGFGGVGIPDCIQQGKGAAQQALAHLLGAKK